MSTVIRMCDWRTIMANDKMDYLLIIIVDGIHVIIMRLSVDVFVVLCHLSSHSIAPSCVSGCLKRIMCVRK